MSADSPREGLRLLAMLMAADLRAGGSALVEAPAETEAPRRGRKPTRVVAIAAHHPIARAGPECHKTSTSVRIVVIDPRMSGATDMPLIETIDEISRETREGTPKDHKKEWGQFFTPDSVAAFMARLPRSDVVGRVVKILDPGAGTGILGVAAATEALRRGAAEVHLTAVEAEPGALLGLEVIRDAARTTYGDRLQVAVVAEDFLSLLQPPIGQPVLSGDFDIAISNPPYFKMPPSQPRGGDAPNAYARFMEVASGLLRPGGDLVFIVPRSFAAGFYFRRFRRRLHTTMDLRRIHVFGSRDQAFKRDSVLQENVIVHYRKQAPTGDEIVVSESTGPDTLDHATLLHVPRGVVLSRSDTDCIINLPTSPEDLEVLGRVDSWPLRLSLLGLEISTGRVVPFRTDALCDEPEAEGTVPLLWLQHVRVGSVRWPIADFRKPQAIRADAGVKLLVPNQTYVLMRRFSAKEDARRLTAGVYEGGTLPGEVIGLENHVNYDPFVKSARPPVSGHGFGGPPAGGAPA